MAAGPALVWYRHDLRLKDNPALAAAFERGGAVVPVFIWDETGEGTWAPGAASRSWLHHSLAALREALVARGGRLIIASGDSAAVLARLQAEIGADAVYWNRRYEPALVARDAAVKRALIATGCDARSFNGSLLHEPHTITNRQGEPFRVFTPFWRHCSTLAVERPSRERGTNGWPAPLRWPRSLELEHLQLRPRHAWDAKLYRHWTPGEAGAQAALRRFLRAGVEVYDQRRDRPADEGTSRLSPHLHYGELSPRQIWAGVQDLGRDQGVFPPNRGAQVFLKELGWREFAYHTLFHFPTMPESPQRPEFVRFPWRADPDGAWRRLWERGETGYPIVDAGMRQLWQLGWMHNRVRMIVASFLVKHLRLPWPIGAAWFWDTLVDADLANNTLGWQWSAGCGADAAPYFRIFNPMLQGAKFDPAGDYVRRWLPELAQLSPEHIHAPWEAPPTELATANVELGRTYPRPLVDHSMARADALAAYQSLSRGRRP